MKWRRIGTLAAAASALMACGGEADGDRRGEEEPYPAPEFEAVTLAGDSVALSDLEGQVVLLNVWATWCTPCRQEIPELQALHEAHGDQGLRVVGVTVDHGGAAAQIRQFIDELGMTYPIWWDPDQTVVSRFDAMGVPLTVLIDRSGHVVWEHLGAFQRGDPELMAAVDRALAVTPDAARSSTD